MLDLGVKKAKDGLYELASSCIKNNSIYKINTKKGNVVLLSENFYGDSLLKQSLQFTGEPIMNKKRLGMKCQDKSGQGKKDLSTFFFAILLKRRPL